MNLHGFIPTTCPPETVLKHLLDPEVLAKIAPDGFVFGTRDAETVSFTFRRRIGVVMLNLTGQLSMRHAPDRGKSHVTLTADHRICGGVSVSLDVTPQTSPDGTRTLSWTGTMESHGLTARIVNERGSQADKIVRTLFERLVDQAAA